MMFLLSVGERQRMCSTWPAVQGDKRHVAIMAIKLWKTVTAACNKTWTGGQAAALGLTAALPLERIARIAAPALPL